ncbi:MAG: response regulator transcription factor [Chloroflexi bacterium]|nr:MAG: response regulator transcription factor [Chloroflexota bacterium]
MAVTSKILVVDDEAHIVELARIYLTREGYDVEGVGDGAQALIRFGHDYLTKPFHPQELVARAKALLRRAKIEPDQPKLIRAGKLEVDLERHEIRHGTSKVQLRPKEFDLLALLARHPGRVFQRSELLDLVWGYDFPGYTRTVDVHVQQVREKLAAAEIKDPSIQTVWGVGYRLELAGSGS